MCRRIRYASYRVGHHIPMSYTPLNLAPALTSLWKRSAFRCPAPGARHGCAPCVAGASPTACAPAVDCMPCSLRCWTRRRQTRQVWRLGSSIDTAPAIRLACVLHTQAIYDTRANSGSGVRQGRPCCMHMPGMDAIGRDVLLVHMRTGACRVSTLPLALALRHISECIMWIGILFAAVRSLKLLLDGH